MDSDIFRQSRIEFGKLIKALRKEQSLRRAGTLTQSTLAERLEAETNVYFSREWVNKLENGRNAIALEPYILLALARIFQLTSKERQEFFLAANFVPATKIARVNHESPEDILENLRSRIAQLQTPAFLTDSTGRIIVANEAFASMYYLETVQDPHYNVLVCLFQIEHLLRRMDIQEKEWTQLVVRSIQIFRGITLRYRGTPYLQGVIEHLYNNVETFGRFWHQAYEEDESYDHHHFEVTIGPQMTIAYSIAFSRILTSYGTLHLDLSVPTNQFTVQAFTELIRNEGASARLFAPWPYNPNTI